jgi:sRNA-binding protein
MTILNEQIDVVVARLAAAFPQTFVLEKHLPHRPLKIGIAADIRAALPDLPRGVLDRALAAYTKRLMYLQAIVVGADRIDMTAMRQGK